MVPKAVSYTHLDVYKRQLFISGEPQQTQQVLAIAFKYLSIMAAMLWVLYFLYVYRSALQLSLIHI